MNCENNTEEIKQAQEYIYLLSKIRFWIEQLDRSKDAQLCLLWLSKLDQCSRNEKCERNQILSELSRQVKRKRLEPPFNVQPPAGSLKNIVLNSSIPLSGISDFSDDASNEVTETEKSPLSSLSTQSFETEHYHNQISVPYNEKFMERSANCLDEIKEVKDDHSQCLAMHKKYREQILNNQLLTKRYQCIIKSLVNQKFKNVGSTFAKSLKFSYENKIYDLVSSLKLVEEENNQLKQKLSSTVASSERLEELESKAAELRQKIDHLEITNNLLELKCRELESEKNSALSELTFQMSESEKRLKESDSHVKAMEKSFSEKFKACETEHEAKVNELEKKYTKDLSALERIIEEKQSEINYLGEQVSSQCIHFEGEVLRLRRDVLKNCDCNRAKRKIKFLKNRIRGLEKIQKNLATTFQSQLEQIISKKDLIISTLEIKLKAKESETIKSATSLQVENSIADEIQNLENQYRKLLEESEHQAAERREMDLQKIMLLEKQLMDLGVGLQEFESVPYEGNLMTMAQGQESESAVSGESDKIVE